MTAVKRIKIAITGTIGSGKSTVSLYLRSIGYKVFDCDKVNGELLLKGHKGYQKLIDVFGNEIASANGINHKKLSGIVFNDKHKLETLNSIMHPLIKEEMQKEMNEGDVFIAEVPLLFETDFYKLFDYKLLVIADEETVLKRLENRGLSTDEALLRIGNQMSVEEKIRLSDYVINNNGDLHDLEADVDEWMEVMKSAWQ